MGGDRENIVLVFIVVYGVSLISEEHNNRNEAMMEKKGKTNERERVRGRKKKKLIDILLKEIALSSKRVRFPANQQNNTFLLAINFNDVLLPLFPFHIIFFSIFYKTLIGILDAMHY
jgi:hypothetical protein